MIQFNNDIDSTHGFERTSSGFEKDFSCIGEGSFGGKASGLYSMNKVLKEKFTSQEFSKIFVSIPRSIVIRTDVFDAFIQRNNLSEIAFSESSDKQIIKAFLFADLPSEILGDLRSIVEHVRVPLAIRSSSMLEDSKYEPFAGIYATKMIPNNQTSPDDRFRKLIEAIKFVYASTFFSVSKEYFNASTHKLENEKMAVIIQEVVGQKHTDRFYPNFSGVAMSYNYYPMGRAKPEDGIVTLALGLGKMIVDGGVAWYYSPKFPKSSPPYTDPYDLLKKSQTSFWSVNMNPVLEFDPTKETEYLKLLTLEDAYYDGTLDYLASTYVDSSQRIVMGTAIEGPRVLNFSQLLCLNEFGFNVLIKKLLSVCEVAMQSPVEIEFAVNINRNESKMHFGFLQVRPMVVSSETIEIGESEMCDESVLVASDHAIGNGKVDNIFDIVFVRPEKFDKRDTEKISREIESINKELVRNKTKYILIGFGRWGSSDPWLGIPVEWGQISGAKAIIESTLFDMNVDLSQGSHFFHNLTSFNVSYFSITFDGRFKIDWNWLNQQKVMLETDFVRHVRIDFPLHIKVDGRKSRGVIKKW
jgi:hypothetical protein